MSIEDVRPMQFTAVANEAAILAAVAAGASYSGNTLIYATAERSLWFSADGAAPSKTNLSVNSPVGSSPGAGIEVSDTVTGPYHQTLITLTALAVSVVSVTTGAGVGGTKVFDFPEGLISFLGASSTLSLAVAEADEADFTDATPEGDIGVGSAAPADADALGTDATDDDYSTATAWTMADYAAPAVALASEAIQQFDGRTTAKDVFVNVLVDAADIDDGVTTEVLVSGTIQLTWVFLGD